VAAEKLIEGLHWQKDEIELLVFISQSRDYVLPATACILQDKMRLPQSCIAFDVSMGCSAFPYGLSIIGNYLAHCGIKKALLLMGDVSYINQSLHLAEKLSGTVQIEMQRQWAEGVFDATFG